MSGATMTLPGIGEVKRQHVYIGAAVAAGVVGYAWWRSRTADDAAPIEDESIAGDDIAADDGWGNIPGRTSDSGGSYVPEDPATIPTRASWTAEVVEKLSGAGWEEQLIYTTVGKWFAGQGLTEAEKQLIQAARAAAGDPPPPVPPVLSALPTPGPTPIPPKPVPPVPPGTPSPRPSPPPTAPASYATVTVAKYTSSNPPWNSTMWGIAKHYGYGSASNNYSPIWNDSKNAGLRALRGRPDLIRANDKVYVKLK